MVIILILAAVAILIGFGVGLYAGIVTVFLITEQADIHTSLDRTEADLGLTEDLLHAHLLTPRR